MKNNSIEAYIRFIAESIEWQNKLLAAVFLDKDTDNSGDESKVVRTGESPNNQRGESMKRIKYVIEEHWPELLAYAISIAAIVVSMIAISKR